MDKRKLSAIPRQTATDEMIDIADRIGTLKHIVTADLIDESMVVIYLYKVSALKKGDKNAAYRTFLSKEDYITQDLSTDKVKWLTAAFDYLPAFSLFECNWDYKTHTYNRIELVYIRSKEEKDLLQSFFKEYSREDDKHSPWTEIYRFQDEVKRARLWKRYKKETDPIDQLMETVDPAPKEFEEWVWDQAMSFSQYLVYTPIGKNLALCECTCCKQSRVVDRNEIRLRNNEKGKCPICHKDVTIKAKGRMSEKITDRQWVVYIDPRKDGFVWRYFHAIRTIERNKLKNPSEILYEMSRNFYSFENGKAKQDSYEYAEFRQSGKTRWCHDNGKVACGLCTLYPNNLPGAWEHTPYKYSALEILAKNVPTVAIHYEWGLVRFEEFPAMEWIIKMGLNKIAEKVINEGYQRDYSGRINYKGKTIYDILKINKVNMRILQQIDGGMDELRLLQVAETINLQFKPEQLREYAETFGCNTDLLQKAKRKASLHKIVKYIAKESEKYPKGETRGCWMRYGYYEYGSNMREDPRVERKQSMAHDWIEYLDWCKKLKYDLNNMFIYMPKNFKAVHDRTANEYQALLDKEEAQKRKRREREVKKRMAQTKAALEELLKENKGTTNAFLLKGKGLLLVIPKSADDIKREGLKLHHCVGTYVDKVARGETSIFFIRREEKPEEPYYTMEWKENQVWQCRGSHNKAMTPEVKAFTKAFEKIMNETIKKSEKKKGKAVPA